jgi:hypothetical protein
MTKIFDGRYTAQLDKSRVLFLIGTRINKLWAVHEWAWFAATMPRMLKELDARPEAGLLWYRTYVSFPVILVQQYWENFDKLLAYAHDKNSVHFPSWARFNKRLANNSVVGIWHETYLVEPGKFECVYGNMPLFGLAAAGAHVPATGRLMAAKDRFKAA